jgi:hypothetical protein
MSDDSETYTQPEKQKARAAVLGHAVESLTRKRKSSALVTVKGFDLLLQYCIKHFRKYVGEDLSGPLAGVQKRWNTAHASRIGKRDASELRVLFLCGPEPLNDLKELTDLGISRQNVWAIEGNQIAYQAAAAQLREAGLPIKLHQGSLSEFLEVVPEQFDIVYFDACGPLFGGKPKTSTVLRELFLNQRMSPLSALITNFAATPRDKEQTWITRLYAWYAPRYFQPIYDDIDGAMASDRIFDGTEFCDHLKKHLEFYYSDFVTRFVIEFVGELLPWWRVRALPSARRAYFAPDKELEAAIEAAFAVSDSPDMEKFMLTTGHGQLSPDSYPFLWLVELARTHLEGNDALLELVTKDTLMQAKLSDAINAISLVRNYFEGHIDWAKHNWDACSDELRGALERFRWFDSEGTKLRGLFCDAPLPNLAVDLLVGVYGYPYHVNLQKLLRLEYCAKQTTMYTDVFILDQCRYMYDLVPTLSMFGDGLPIDRQFQIRICMNLIRLHLHESCWELFRGSALAGMEVKGFGVHAWPKRKVLV